MRNGLADERIGTRHSDVILSCQGSRVKRASVGLDLSAKIQDFNCARFCKSSQYPKLEVYHFSPPYSLPPGFLDPVSGRQVH